MSLRKLEYTFSKLFVRPPPSPYVTRRKVTNSGPKLTIALSCSHSCVRHVPDWLSVGLIARLLCIPNVRRLLRFPSTSVHRFLSNGRHIVGVWKRQVSGLLLLLLFGALIVWYRNSYLRI